MSELFLPDGSSLAITGESPSVGFAISVGERSLDAVGELIGSGITAYVATGALTATGRTPTGVYSFVVSSLTPSTAVGVPELVTWYTASSLTPSTAVGVPELVTWYAASSLTPSTAVGTPVIPETRNATALVNTTSFGTVSLQDPIAVSIPSSGAFGIAMGLVQATSTAEQVGATGISPGVEFGSVVADIYRVAVGFAGIVGVGVARAHPIAAATALAATGAIGTAVAWSRVQASALGRVAVFGIPTAFAAGVARSIVRSTRIGQGVVTSVTTFPWSYVTSWVGPRGA